MSLSVANVLDFIVSVIIVKGIIVHYVVAFVNKGLVKWFGTTDRKKAIYEHYRLRALEKGHEDNNVELCGQGNCQLFI